MMNHYNVSEKLSSITSILSSVAIKCGDIIFEKKCTISDQWKCVEELSGTFEHLITMGSSNEQYRALIFAGVSTSSLKKLLDEDELDGNYIFDVLGEFVNSYCALLDDNEVYCSKFGKQIQAVPLLFSNGAPFIPFLNGVQGTITIGEEKIYMGYVIQKHVNELESEMHSGK